MEYRVVVCDDERVFRMKLEKILQEAAEEWGQKLEVVQVENAAECMKELCHSSIDLLFLDIDLPDMNGIRLARKIRSRNRNLLIIFISGHEEYVFQSFEVQPFRFVRKGQIELDLYLALKGAFKVLEQRKKRYILVGEKDQEERVDTSDIMYAELWKRKIHIYFKNSPEVIMKITMREFMDRLAGDERFTLIHSGMAVNAAYVKSYTRQDVTLLNEERLPVARTRAEQVKGTILKYRSRL